MERPGAGALVAGGGDLLLTGQPRMVAQDARASVRAGFTRRGALAVARRVGIDRPRYRTVLFHRFTLTASRVPGE